jgi:hypothetical protein
MGAQPLQHLVGVAVGREDRVEGVLDPIAGDDQRQAAVQPLSGRRERRQVQGVSQAEGRVGEDRDLMLVVEDLDAARAELSRGGAEVSEVWHDETGIFRHGGTEAQVPGRDPENRSYGSWASFSDPDGNGWRLQEIVERLPGRVS